MEYLIGVGLAVLVCVFATLVGFDRDRVFYPTLATVIGTYYILFAVIGNSTRALGSESLIAAAFLALAVAGFKKSLWLAVAMCDDETQKGPPLRCGGPFNSEEFPLIEPIEPTFSMQTAPALWAKAPGRSSGGSIIAKE